MRIYPRPPQGSSLDQRTELQGTMTGTRADPAGRRAKPPKRQVPGRRMLTLSSIWKMAAPLRHSPAIVDFSKADTVRDPGDFET